MRKSSRWPLLLSTFFDHLSLNITFPVLTFVFFDNASRLFPSGASHSERSLWYGLCVSLPYFAGMLATPLLSSLSDHWGRKKILLIGALGALVFALFSVWSILSGLVVLMLIGYLIGGLCARTEPTALAAIADISTPEHKVIDVAYLQVVISLGAFLGPILGGMFAHRINFTVFNFSMPAIIAAFFALCTVFVTALFFRETKTQSEPKTDLKTSLQQFYQKPILKLAAILCLMQISWSVYYQFIPPVLKLYLQFSAPHIGVFVGLIAAWLMLTTLFGIRILKQFFSESTILLLGIISLLVGLLITNLGLWLHLNFLLWLSAPLVAGGDVAGYCVLMSFFSKQVSEHDQGKIMGLGFIVAYGTWAVMSLLAGMLSAWHVCLPIILAPLAVLTLLFLPKLRN